MEAGLAHSDRMIEDEVMLIEVKSIQDELNEAS
jgi:hypothetical protein